MKKPPRGYVRTFDPAAKKPISRKSLVQVMTDIFWGYEERRGTRTESPDFQTTKNEDPKYFLRREIYELGIFMMKVPPTSYSTSDLVAKVRGRPTTRPDVELKTFHALIMCVYEDDHNGRLDRKERWDISKELSYAYRHKIPPELLCGFLLQSGKRSEIPKKLKAGYIEPAFRNSATADFD